MHYLISECCDAIPDHEHVSQITGEERHQGICSDCKEHAEFVWNDTVSYPTEDPELHTVSLDIARYIVNCMPEIVDEVAYLLRLAYNNYESREQDIDPVEEMKDNYMYNQTVKPWNAKRD